MVWSSNGREHKDTGRAIVFCVRPKNSVLLLPGYHLKDVRLALQRNVIHSGTHCVFVERDEETFHHIQQFVDLEWPFDHKPTLVNRDLCRVPLPHKLDFAFIDLCGNLVHSDALWIRNRLAHKLLPGADLAFTFTLQTRNNKFIKEAVKVIASQYGTLYNENEEIQPVVAAYIILFKHVFFPNYDFGISIFDYHDIMSHYNMLLIRLSNMQPKETGSRSSVLDDMLGEPKVSLCLNRSVEGGYIMPTTKKKTTGTKKTETATSVALALAEATTPQQKSAAKRRLTALKKQREAEGVDPKMVEAGVKSWVTRYQNQK